MNRYKIEKTIGDGSYGLVLRATMIETGDIVAVKKMKRKFSTWQECMELREIRSLKKFSHPSIIKLREVIRENEELYFVFEYCEANLYQVMRNMKATLGEAKIRNMMLSVFSGLAYIHRSGFFHRDIKPENILCTSDGENCKLADFGLAKEIRSRPPFTDYVSTRWYRSPELLLRATIYNSPVDMWAAGVLMAEMYTMRPLFPGTSESDMMFKICSVLGSPTMSTWPDGLRLASSLGVRLPQMVTTPFAALIPNASQEALQVINALLTYDPNRRPTAAEVTTFPFFTSYFPTT